MDEQSIAHYNSRPTPRQLYAVSDTLSNWFENHRGQKFPPSLNTPFIQNSNRMAFSVDCNCEFFKCILSTPAAFKVSSKLFGSQDCSDCKTTLIFPAFSLRFVDFAVQFCFRCKFSFHRKPFKSSWRWRDFPGPITILLLHIATNEIASFSFWQQITSNCFFVFAEVGKGQLSSFELKKL